MVMKAKVSRGETALIAELARIGVDISEGNARRAVLFAVELIKKRDNTPPDWRRRFRRLAAHAIAARVPGVANKGDIRRAHQNEVEKHMVWLLKKGVSGDELKGFSLGIADLMRE